jgi:hypothetical protein
MLVAVARQRVGGMLREMERVSYYGPVLAVMDAEALQWAKQAHSLTMSPTFADQTNGGNVQVTNEKSRVSGNSSSGAVLKGDVSSTRRVVLSLQSLLLATPLRDRDLVLELLPPNNALLSFTRYRSWAERKARCDALLALCNAMAPLSSSNRKKTYSSDSNR